MKLRLRPIEDVTNNPRCEAVMSEQAQAIFDQAMKLSVAERERLVSQLMCSIDDAELSPEEQAAHDAAWAPEIRRRLAEITSGAVETIPWSVVKAEIEAMIGE